MAKKNKNVSLDDFFSKKTKLDTSTGNISKQTDRDEVEDFFGSAIPKVDYTPTSTADRGVGESVYDEGILPQNVDNLQQRRAERQPGYAQAGAAMGRAILGLPLGVAENATYLANLQAVGNTLQGTGSDYTTDLTELIKERRGEIDEMMPIYREDPNKVIDMGDPAWWAEHGSGLLESIGEFAVTGFGVGSIAGKGANAIAKMIGKGSKTLAKTGQGLTAAGLTWTESAMVGADVYKELYSENLDRLIKQGIPEEQAQEQANNIASQGAGKSVKINMSINAPLNFTSAGLLMKSPKLAKQMEKSFGKIKGETNKEWLTRLKTRPEFESLNHNFALTTGSEMGQESIEELVNAIAEEEGLHKGKELAGTLKEWEKKPLSERLEEVIKSDEGRLSMVLGAVGGGGQHAISFNMPDAKNNRQAEVDRYNKQADYIIEKVEKFRMNQEAMKEALDKNDDEAYAQASNKLFNQNLFDVYVNGAEGQVQSLFEEVAQMDEETAQEQGYDIDPDSDTYYKKVAQDKVADIKKLSKDYESIMTKYSAGNEDAINYGYGETVFAAHLEKKNLDDTIKRNQEALAQAKSNHQENLNTRGTEAGIAEIINLQDKVTAYEKAASDLQSKKDEITKLASSKTGKKILKSMYGVPPKGTSMKNHALKSIDNTNKDLEKKANQASKEFEKIKKDFAEAGNSVANLNEQLNLTTKERDEIIFAEANIAAGQSLLKEADKTYKALTSKEGRDLFINEQKSINEKERKSREQEAKRKQDAEKLEREREKREAAKDKKRAQKEQKEAKAKAKRDSDGARKSDTPGGLSDEEIEGLSPMSSEEAERNRLQEIDENDLSEEEEGLVEAEETKPEKGLEDGEIHNVTNNKIKEAQEVEDKGHSNNKVIEAGATFAYLAKEYKVVDGTKETSTNEKNTNLYKELESQNHFQVGDKVTLEIDKVSSWEDAEGNTVSYTNYVSPDGTVDIDNVPIAIKRGDDIVAHVRTQDWINAKDDNGVYLNVANSDSKGEPMYNNAETQARINKQLREYVLNNGSIEVTITDKSHGSISKNTEGSDLMSNTMNGVKEFTIVKNGEFHFNKDDVYSNNEVVNSKEFKDNLNDYNGSLFAVLPTPVKGSVLMAPVKAPNLSTSQVDTIFNTLKTLLSGDSNTAKQVFNESGHDINTPSGTLNFLRTITHTLDEKDSDFIERVNKDGSLDSRHLNVSTKTGAIQYARHNKGINQILTFDDLLAQEDSFKEFLSEKLISVNISSINNDEEVSQVIINNDGTIEAKNFTDYNEYLKGNVISNLTSASISEDEDVFFDQPTIKFGTEFLDETSIQKDIAEGQEPGSSPEIDEAGEISDDDIDELFEIDDSLEDQNTDESVLDYSLSPEQQEIIRGSITDFLVVDTKSGIPFNSYKQSQVVDSIIYLTTSAMQSGLNTTEAIESAKKVFSKRRDAFSKIENNFSDVKQSVKDKLNLSTVDDAAEMAEEFDRVVRNWDDFKKHTVFKLAKVFGVKETLQDVPADQTTEDILEGYEELESVLEKVNFDDGATFQTNHKDTASARFKLFLALQEKPTRSYLNLKAFVPFDEVYDDLQMMLAGWEPDFDSMAQHLSVVGAGKDYIPKLVEKLNNQNEQIKNEFVVAFSKQYNPFITVLWNSSQKGFYQLTPIDTNRNAVVNRIENDWIESQKRSSIVKTINGELTIDPVVATEFKNKVEKAKDNPTVEEAESLLNMIGVNIPTEALEHLEKHSKSLTGMTFKQHFTSGIFNHMSTALNKKNPDTDEVESKLDLNNPLTGINKEGSSIRTLAYLTAQFSPTYYSNSHRDSEGKTIYSYSLNSHLSHTMRRLLSSEGDNGLTKGLSKISFSSNSSWLKQIKKDSKFRNVFKVSYLDGLSKRYSGQKGVKRKRQSDREMEVQAIALFQNRSQGEAGGRKISHFVYPTISDKTTTPIITAVRHNIEVQIEDNLKFGVGPTTRKELLNIVRAEMNRIENYKTPSKKEAIKGYDTGGALKFFTFPGLNEIADIVTEEDGTHKIVNREVLEKEVFKQVHELIQDRYKSWLDSGIVTKDKLFMDQSYILEAKGNLRNSDNFKVGMYAAIDMEINYLIANMNVMQLIAGDPATHFKKNEDTTLVEIQKRLAKDIAPGLDGHFTNTKYKVVYLNDKETNSQHLEEYKSVLGDKADAYTGIEGTDAQEYTTLKEHLDVMYAYGKLNPEQYERMTSAKVLNDEDLKVILQPMKPVQVANDILVERDLNRITYIKSSSFPLIPQLTKGLEIDKLRQQMESHGIARAAYVSAAKLGSAGTATIWDGHSMTEDLDLSNNAVTLDRRGFRIQQEVPYKESKKEILTVSQMNKLLFEGILHIDGMAALKNRKEQIRQEMFKKGQAKLFKELGVKKEGNNYVFTDLNKVKKVLEEEARSRGYSINDIQSLELNEEGTAFIIPLVFNNSSTKFESLLLSMVTNKILKQKMPGKSYVQGSSAGFMTGATESKSWSDLTAKELGDIVWTGDVDMNKGLQFIRKGKGAQLLVPFYFLDASGKKLNIKDYITEVDGKTVIDTDKIDPELLRMIGARIPNQGHSSMLPIEIAGFLPESMGDLIIVPDEITKQMGSDFDVDKLFTYHYNYNITPEGLKKTELSSELPGLQNEYIDIHWEVLTHPEVMGRVLSPLDKTGEYSVAGEAEKISGIRKAGATQKSFLSRGEQQKGFIQNRAGKAGVGIFSLASTFNAQIQDKNLQLGVWENKEFVPIYITIGGMNLQKLSGVGKNPKGDKASVISDMQSAAVDNAKEQRLDKLNLNSYTFSAANALAQLETPKGMNVDIQYISRLLSQPIIIDYISTLESLSDSTVEEFVSDRQAEAEIRTLDKYGQSVGGTIPDIDGSKLTPEYMLKMIYDEEETPTSEWVGAQFTALKLFLELDSVGKQLSNIQNSINSDSAGVGKDLLTLSDKVNRINNLNKLPTVRGAVELLNEGEINTANELGPLLANSLYRSFFPYSTDKVDDMNVQLLNISRKEDLLVDDKQRIFNGYKTFLFSGEGMFTEETINVARHRLLIDTPDNKSLATRVKAAQKSWGRNNFLLQRLSTKSPDVKGNMSLVTYAASTGARLDEQEAIKSFVDMLISDNPEQVELAKDLVTYSYLTSPLQGATNFIKFIPTSYLKALGIGAKLSNTNWTASIEENFIKQYIQHNPDVAPKAPDDIKPGESFDFPIPDENTPSKYAMYLGSETQSDGSKKDNVYPRFLHARDTKANKYYLYELSFDGDKSKYTYTPINTLGGERGISEYTASQSNTTSLEKKNNVKTIDPKVKVTMPSPERPVDNPEANTQLLKKYGLTNGANRGSIVRALKVIGDNSTHTGHRTIAKILAASGDALPQLTFTTRNYRGKGFFDMNTNEVNVNVPKMKSAYDFENTFLHEVIHAFTTSSVRTVGKGGGTAAQKRAVTSIKALQKKVIDSLTAEDKKKFNALIERYKEQEGNTKLSQEEKDKFYGLIKTEEFITMVMTHEPFQEFLNSHTFSGDTTLLDRFMEIINKLVKVFADSSGINIGEDSALKQALTDIIDLINHTGNSSDSTGNDYSLSDAENLGASQKQIRKEFGLLNNDGSVKRYTSWERAFAKAKALNTTNNRFKREYGSTYKAVPTKVPGEKGDSRIYYNVRFEVRDTKLYDLEDEILGAKPKVDPVISKMIDRIDTRITNYKRAMSDTKEDKAAIRDKIEVLENQKERLLEGNNLKVLNAVAKSHLDWAERMTDTKQITPAMLREIDNTIAVWQNLKEVFYNEYEEGGKFKDTIASIAARADDLALKWAKINRAVMLDEANKNSTREVKLDHLKYMNDISMGPAMVLDLASYDNEFTQSLDEILKNSGRDTTYEFNQWSKEISANIEDFKKTDEFKKNGFDRLLQKDSDGNWTGHLTIRYAQAYYDARAKKRRAIDKSRRSKKALKEYYQWERVNSTIVDSRLLFNEEGDIINTNTASGHITKLKNEFGEARAQELIDQAQEKYQQYLLDKDAYQEDLNGRVESDPEYSEKDAKLDMSAWIIRNSPKTYLASHDGTNINRDAKGWDYVVSVPKKIYDSGKKTKWYDENFEVIENNPELKKFYDFFRDTMGHMMAELPTYDTYNLQNNFIPSIKKDLIESYKARGMRGALTSAGSTLVDQLTSVEEGISADRDIHTGRVNKRIPVRFVEASLPVEERSKDLGKMLEAFTLMSLNYKHKAKVEDTVLLMQRVINEAIEQKLDSQKNEATDSQGNLYQVNDGLTNLKKVVQHAIDVQLYNKKREEGTPTGLMASKQGVKASIKATKLAKKIQRINREAMLGKISFEDHTKMVAPLQEELKELGGKNITDVDIADLSMKLTQIKGMGYNVFAATNNMTFGLISNIIQAAGGEDFTLKESARAYRIMLNSTMKGMGADNKTGKKIANLMEKFDVLFEVDESAYNGNKKRKKSNLSKFNPYEMQRRSEYFVQGQNMVARMLNEKVTTLDGRETSLFEAFDENGEWRSDVYGENAGWEGDINNMEDMKDFRTFRNRLIEINKIVHGNYDPNSFPMAKRFIFGRFALQFRSWLAESWERRMGQEKYNAQLGRNVKGFYRTIGNNPMTFFRQFLLGNQSLENLSPVDQANLRKGMVEMVVILGTMAAGLLITMAGDDDDDDKMVGNLLLNQIYRLESDMTFYISPSSFNRILSNPIPAIRSYLDAERAISRTIDYMVQSPELDGRKKMASEDVFYNWAKVFPFINQTAKFKTQSEKIFK